MLWSEQIIQYNHKQKRLPQCFDGLSNLVTALHHPARAVGLSYHDSPLFIRALQMLIFRTFELKIRKNRYVKLLVANGIRVNMTKSGDPKENAQAKCVNGTLTPVEASNLTGELEKKWKSYMTAAIKKKMHDTDITEKGLPLPCC